MWCVRDQSPPRSLPGKRPNRKLDEHGDVNGDERTAGRLPRPGSRLPGSHPIGRRPPSQEEHNFSRAATGFAALTDGRPNAAYNKNSGPSRPKFYPPQPKASSQARSRSPPARNQTPCKQIPKLCRNGAECTRTDCYFMHPVDRIATKPVPTDGSNVIFVGRVWKEVTQDQFCTYFKQFGPVLSAKIKEDYEGRTRGFGFVTFADAEAAENAVQAGHRVWDIKRKRDMD